MTHPVPGVLYGLMVVLPPLTLAISIPLIFGLVRPNRWYGVRTRKTLSSPQLWYRANRVGGICLTVATLAALAVWGLLAWVPMDPPLRVALDLAVLAASVLAASALMLAQVRRM
jgi:hypothetical protein